MYYWKKPKNLKYTDMCKWIDENATKEDCDQIQLFNYLYGLILILAYKWKYFDSIRDYDDFAVSTASTEFRRITAKDKPRINYILPYLKKILYFRKISWQRMYCKEEDSIKTQDSITVDYRIRDLITGGINKCNFQIYLEDISSAIYDSIKGIPREIGTSEFENIYISCLLTFINQITIPLKDEKLMKSTKSQAVHDSAYKRIYRIECKKEPILYHLDNSYSDYITFLVNRAKATIRDELSELLYENYANIPLCVCIGGQNDHGKLEETEYS